MSRLIDSQKLPGPIATLLSYVTGFQEEMRRHRIQFTELPRSILDLLVTGDQDTPYAVEELTTWRNWIVATGKYERPFNPPPTNDEFRVHRFPRNFWYENQPPLVFFFEGSGMGLLLSAALPQRNDDLRRKSTVSHRIRRIEK